METARTKYLLTFYLQPNYQFELKKFSIRLKLFIRLHTNFLQIYRKFSQKVTSLYEPIPNHQDNTR